METVLANQAQGSLFDKTEAEEIFKVSRKVPYTFSYVFTSEDDSEHTLMIEDWEVGMLYWNCLKAANGNESVACQKVKEKYFDDFAKRRDLYFLLGTTKRFHNTSPNPFIIIGTFHPLKKADSQPTLF